MKQKFFGNLTLRLATLFERGQRQKLRTREVFPEHERESPTSEYEMYYWGFSPAPWY
ncbi:hypothetical protein [Rhizobium tumorigenes]|uniref:Uncharacterized protein n=1 Tax=Rhizobium tumorigenes TaxID=2041385 RepID=A0AAF1KGZ8_9HYPH|nr:hypothetical protein [Rhizobium tumorigenes]WFR98087.1 hypothetical protein PR017_19660 [Rhizobium tumorigenes]